MKIEIVIPVLKKNKKRLIIIVAIAILIKMRSRIKILLLKSRFMKRMKMLKNSLIMILKRD
jgi:hypothetical protein